jgi:hypothetical protein
MISSLLQRSGTPPCRLSASPLPLGCCHGTGGGDAPTMRRRCPLSVEPTCGWSTKRRRRVTHTSSCLSGSGAAGECFFFCAGLTGWQVRAGRSPRPRLRCLPVENRESHFSCKCPDWWCCGLSIEPQGGPRRCWWAGCGRCQLSGLGLFSVRQRSSTPVVWGCRLCGRRPVPPLRAPLSAAQLAGVHARSHAACVPHRGL